MSSKKVDIDSLIAQMSLPQKLGQLTVLADALRPFAFDVNPDTFPWPPDVVSDMIRKGEIGALFNGVGAREGYDLQRMAVEESPHGIPLLLGADVIHGMRTMFPIPLGEAASFEPALAERTARAAAVEATAEGLHWTYAPMVDISRDQRWGRVAETAGEDTHLCSVFAAARVRGFQGPRLDADDSMLATPKHFAAYGAAAAGLDYSGADISEQTLREVHLPPFRAAIDAGALSIMSAFNDVNGVPATANRHLLTTVLRDEWGFEGFVVSDYTSDFELIDHGFAEDEKHAAQLSLNAGLDMSMQSGVFMKHLADCVADGSVSMATIDEAVRRVLTVKQRMGLFENPYRSLRESDQPAPWIAEHDALARDAARRSVVMLRNDGVLPLARDTARIALIGPFAEDRDNLDGCWSIFSDRSRSVDLVTGLRAAMGHGGQLDIVQGSGIETDLDGGIDAAVTAAAAADVVLLAVGEPANFSGEAQSRTQIVLPDAQRRLIAAVRATGTPVVLLLRTGRALALDDDACASNAILLTWFLGTQTGHAIADILFGDYNPSGRLPISFPRDAGQQPFYYNRLASGRPYQAGGPEAFRTRWRETPNEARFPFGHGLGYAPFRYGTPHIDSASLAWDGQVVVEVDITNEGTVAGEEVVQLYVRDRVGSRVRPIRELKGFQKIRLEAGESARVSFRIDRAMLAFCRADGVFDAEPGWFDAWVAPSSTAGEPVSFALMAAG